MNTDIKRDRRAAMRKTQILNAAASVFAERGFHRATTREIADAAQVAEGTIYNYFTNKDEVLLALIHKVIDISRLERLPERSPEQDVKSFYAELLTQYLDSLKPALKMFHAVIPEILASPHLREFYHDHFLAPTLDLLHHHLKIEHHSNARLMAQIFTALMTGFYLMSAVGVELENTDALVTNLVNLIFEDRP